MNHDFCLWMWECGKMFTMRQSCHSAAVEFITCQRSCRKKRRWETQTKKRCKRATDKHHDSPGGEDRTGEVKRKKHTGLVWEWGTYMRADIQEKWMLHKAPLSESRLGERSSCLFGRATVRSSPQLPEPAEKWPIHTLDIGSVFNERWDIETHTTYTGRCVFLTTCSAHRGTFRTKCLKQVQTQAHTLYLTTWQTYRMIWAPLRDYIYIYYWCFWLSSISHACKNTLLH